ncbi:hypothetical protein DX873_15390 [Flagellimonas nanhaiensis]|uniref:Uncharacterized protein n=1 Tax=Flagellimonas nanhaiensis TaxID=2292706 RepID=A0A371JMM7_9FLAO|nr:hypothetical protein DX873_15390 [Allomuricauda nanhaiensis]
MLIKILDIYYRRPLLFDFLINIAAVSLIFFIEYKGYYAFSFDKTSQVIPSIGITISGFILTVLTILLTLKSSLITKEENGLKETLRNNFSIFLASDLYSKAISVLRNGVIYLLIVSFVTLGISVVLKNVYAAIGLYLNVVCFIFTLLVFLRSFYVLNLIFKMQGSKSNE